jgi:hypothetical protein
LEAAFDARRTFPPQRIDKAAEVPLAYRPELADAAAPPKADKQPQPVSDQPPGNASDLLAELETAFDIPRTLPPQRIGNAPHLPPAYRPEPASVAAAPKADQRTQPTPVLQNASFDDEAIGRPLPSQGSERRQDVAVDARSPFQPVQPLIKTALFRPNQGAVNDETGGEVAVVPPRPERAPLRQARYVPGPVGSKPPLAPAPVVEAPAKPGLSSYLAGLRQPTEPTSRRLPAPLTDKDATGRREHRDIRADTSTANRDIVPTASVIPNSAKTDVKRTAPPKWTPASCQPSLF